MSTKQNRKAETMFVSQGKYVEIILNWFDMANSKAVSTLDRYNVCCYKPKEDKEETDKVHKSWHEQTIG